MYAKTISVFQNFLLHFSKISLGEPVCVYLKQFDKIVEILTVGTQFPVYSTVSGRNLAGGWATWSTSLRALWLGRTELWGSHRARPVIGSIWQLPHSPEGPIHEGVSGTCNNERKTCLMLKCILKSRLKKTPNGNLEEIDSEL